YREEPHQAETRSLPAERSDRRGRREHRSRGGAGAVTGFRPRPHYLLPPGYSIARADVVPSRSSEGPPYRFPVGSGNDREMDNPPNWVPDCRPISQVLSHGIAQNSAVIVPLG